MRFQQGVTTTSVAKLKLPSRQDPVHILVVDYEPLLCHLLRISLQQVGYVASTATRGQDALDRLKQGGIDLVLMDIAMPDMDGYALCSTLRSSTTIPIVILSSLSCPEHLLLGFRAGADAYIAKPFQFREIEACVQRLLQKTAMRA
jgi:DNA-binding response OmpR family regulator